MALALARKRRVVAACIAVPDVNARIAQLKKRMGDLGIGYKDLNTHQSSLEDIFVSLVSDRRGVRT